MPRTQRIPPCEKRTAGLKDTIAANSGLAKTAAALGYKTMEAVRQFIAFDASVPGEVCRRFVAISGGRLTLSMLRPDIYGTADDPITSRELGYPIKRGTRGREAS